MGRKNTRVVGNIQTSVCACGREYTSRNFKLAEKLLKLHVLKAHGIDITYDIDHIDTGEYDAKTSTINPTSNKQPGKTADMIQAELSHSLNWVSCI